MIARKTVLSQEAPIKVLMIDGRGDLDPYTPTDARFRKNEWLTDRLQTYLSSDVRVCVSRTTSSLNSFLNEMDHLCDHRGSLPLRSVNEIMFGIAVHDPKAHARETLDRLGLMIRIMQGRGLYTDSYRAGVLTVAGELHEKHVLRADIVSSVQVSDADDERIVSGIVTLLVLADAQRVKRLPVNG